MGGNAGTARTPGRPRWTGPGRDDGDAGHDDYDDYDDDAYVDVVHRTWRHAATRPDAVAIRHAGDVWSYDDLVRASSRHARRFVAGGLAPGDRVLLVAPTSVGFVQAYLGILAAGAVAVTVNPMCTARELQYFAEDSGCRLVIGWHENARIAADVAGRLDLPFVELHDIAPGADDEVFEPVERAPDDPAVLLYTSGTTGRPKGAIITFGNIFASTWALCRTFDTTADDRIGTALPLFHVYGQVAVLACALDAGASVSLLRPFSGEGALRMAERDGLTVLCDVPTMWVEMLESARTLDPLPNITSLRLAASGGAALPVEINRAFAAMFGAGVADGYGLSETTATATCHRPGREPREGSVGQAVPGVEISVVDELGRVLPPGEIGEITVAGKNVMAGYRGRPEATAEAFSQGRHSGAADRHLARPLQRRELPNRGRQAARRLVHRRFRGPWKGRGHQHHDVRDAHPVHR
ncbi:AMP-binding protein [Thermopolyspora sp. NPDC052614]|uniref:AMP-binding protein n=1 Tax=Thermopolyspora sp. NPDC052614 TaxID=3155682 RepID=UPI00343D1208